MDLQSLFYVLAIIMMLLIISVLVVALYYLIKLQSVVNHVTANVKAKIDSLVAARKSQIAGGLATAASVFVLKKVKEAFKKKNSVSSSS
ncbi:MAG: hypothetical protein Q7S61_03255 [bacterium]|nr:hypothetical protein [bacterium]